MPNDAAREAPKSRWWTAPLYLAIVGIALLALGWFAIVEGSEGAATIAFILGGGALIAAPFVPRLEGLRFGPFQLTLREVVIQAVATADPETLAGVLPLLTGSDVSVGRVRLPDRFVGHRLIDEELGFLRQKLNVSVLGVLEPGEAQWRAGGAISELELPPGAELLVAGASDTVAYLRMLIAADQSDLWNRVT